MDIGDLGIVRVVISTWSDGLIMREIGRIWHPILGRNLKLNPAPRFFDNQSVFFACAFTAPVQVILGILFWLNLFLGF